MALVACNMQSVVCERIRFTISRGRVEPVRSRHKWPRPTALLPAARVYSCCARAGCMYTSLKSGSSIFQEQQSLLVQQDLQQQSLWSTMPTTGPVFQLRQRTAQISACQSGGARSCRSENANSCEKCKCQVQYPSGRAGGGNTLIRLPLKELEE